MDRNIVYPGAVPLDTDLLNLNLNTMIALGYLMRATLGSSVAADGLACTATSPSSMSVQVGPGSMTQFMPAESTPYGSLPADLSTSLMKMGINVAPHTFSLTAPVADGQSISYLIQGQVQEADTGLTVLTYYNAANPSQPYSGPSNSGQPQATFRRQTVQLSLKTGIPSATGTQITPSPDDGWSGLYVIAVQAGQTTIGADAIAVHPNAPFVTWKLPALKPGFGSGVQVFSAGGSFVVPPGIHQVEVEVWGGGSGSYASTATSPSGGGSGGGYARKLVAGLSPGQAVAVTIGTGGVPGAVAGARPGPGGVSSFGQYASATGGSLNYLASPGSPQYGATPAGIGINGDVNLSGSAGQAAYLNQGGMGGGAPMGGGQNSGTTGVQGTNPGGGAAGAGTGANGMTPFDGAAGAAGMVVVRW